MIHLPEDNFKHQGMRKKLIDQLRLKGIDNEGVLTAMMKVPRHFFLDLAFLNQAYSDHAFQIGAGQTISQPYTVAYQTSLLNIKKRRKSIGDWNRKWLSNERFVRDGSKSVFNRKTKGTIRSRYGTVTCNEIFS